MRQPNFMKFLGYSLNDYACVCAQLWLTLWDPMDCSPPGFSVRGILQARILEQVAISSSRGSSRPRDRTLISYISCIGKQFFTASATWEAPKWL